MYSIPCKNIDRLSDLEIKAAMKEMVWEYALLKRELTWRALRDQYTLAREEQKAKRERTLVVVRGEVG